ncbi:MAG: DUF4426 domain-containing protein [Steroidobacteraceae bacterium]
MKSTRPAIAVVRPRAPWGACAGLGIVVAAGAGMLLAGCDSGAHRRPQAARPAENSYQEFGNFQVHYNAIRTDALPPEMAHAYGIERSPNRVMLNVVLLEKAPDGTTRPVDGSVTASARNLNGQLKPLRLRRLQEGASVSFVGEVGISGAEILVYDIEVQPRGAASPYTVQLRREFFAD